MTWGSAAVVAVIVAVTVYYLVQPSAPARPYVTTLLKGEFRDVPNACRVIAPASLSTYLNGHPAKAVQTFATATKSECTNTVDTKATFRELDTTIQAYQPSLIAPGDGSATSYARYTFSQTRQLLAAPPKNMPEPPATISNVSSLGAEAIAAVQYFRESSRTDLVTVLVRVHNVLITIKLWASTNPGFGRVSIPQVKAYAMAAARTTVAAVSRQPAVT
jgi:hypothetical protein